MITSFSQRLAFILGVFFPVAETFRRWHQFGQLRNWPFILDDYLMGALLLAGALLFRRSAQKGKSLLAGAWGFSSGMMYGSFFGQLEGVLKGADDPSGFPSECILIIKGVLLALCVAGLVTALRPWRPTPDRTDAQKRAAS